MRAGATRFADLSPWTARAILVGFILLVGWGFLPFVARPETIAKPREARNAEEGDMALHLALLRRVHAGHDYYDAAHEELRQRGFPSRSPFNYRLPTLAWALQVLPDPAWGLGLLALFAGASLLLWLRVLRQEGASLVQMAAGGLLLCGPLVLSLLPEGTGFPELWAGIGIGLSLAAHARGWTRLAVVLGTCTLLIRELALPYAVIMLVLAWREGRRSEAAGWAAGMSVFAVLFAWHTYQVSLRVTDLDQLGDSWVQFGGWAFVMATARWNAYLLAVPDWAAVLVVPLAVLGLAGWRGPVGTRAALTVGGYVGAFLVVGRPDNHYWGMLYGPLLPLGWVLAPACLVDLWRSKRWISDASQKRPDASAKRR